MKMTSGKRAIDKIYRRRDRYEVPDWQRTEVWDRPKKQLLIDSILRGWKLPKFSFIKYAEDPEAYEVVDGQQRLIAIWEFFDGLLPLSSESTKQFGAKDYEGLSDELRDAFDDFEIEYDEISDATEKEQKQYFQRLQQGIPLTSSERLNAEHSKLRDFLKKATTHAFFGKVAASARRYGHFDVMAKVAAIEIEGLDVGLRYDDLRAVFESQVAFSSSSKVAKRLHAALDFASAGLSEGAPFLRNRTIVQSVLTMLCKLALLPELKGQERQIMKFFKTFVADLNRQVELGPQATDVDYISFQQTVTANVKSGAVKRHRILWRKLLAAMPEIAALLDAGDVSQLGIKGALSEEALDVGRRITTLNEQYAAVHGTNLFKPTNRTVRALANIGKPVDDLEGYKTFVDDLYFLVCEGPGQRLGEHEPSSFKDVNALRTDLQHDVEHGAAKKVRKKKKDLAEVFRRYSGEASPAGLAPERFQIVQANVLAAVRRDLAGIEPSRLA